MSTPKEHKIIAAAQLISAIGLLILWLIQPFAPETTQETGGYRFLFTSSSPLPDLLLAVALCLSAYALLTGRRWGKTLSLVSALYLVYLGALDVGIPFRGSILALSIIDITANGALNLWCVVMGLYTIVKLKGSKPGPSPERD